MQLTAMCGDSLPAMIEISLETRRKNIKCSFNFFKHVFCLSLAFFNYWKGKLFLDLFFYFSWTTLLKFTLITFLRSHLKTRKNITGPHASVHFENGQNAKNARENEKMYDRATCLCAFQKWAKCQKRLKSTELNKKFHNRDTSEEKMKDDVVRQPTFSANCKLCKVILAYTLTK